MITYSSLISACEKAGRWELALDLFSEMHREGCKPNVVTYNSLIAACAQGAGPTDSQISSTTRLPIADIHNTKLCPITDTQNARFLSLKSNLVLCNASKQSCDPNCVTYPSLVQLVLLASV